MRQFNLSEYVAEPPKVTDGIQADVLQRLSRIETMVQSLLDQRSVKEWYSTAEIAELLGKAEFTVREWCRLGRIRAEKWMGGRGAHSSWVVSHDELLRYHREGLLTLDASQ